MYNYLLSLMQLTIKFINAIHENAFMLHTKEHAAYDV